jgi:formate hydrogenlyase subunit 6/NADH:ubiquinone oxidoreductase subunit I
MYLPKLREIKEALTSLFSAPYTTKYPAGRPPAFPDYRGLPRYDAEHCLACGTCAQVCPSQAIEVMDDLAAGKRRLRVDYGSCIQCGQCQEHCLTGEGIRNTNDYSLSASGPDAPEMFHEIEKDLVLCESCGAVVAGRDHLLWIKERLGAKAYAHPNLLLTAQRDLTGIGPSRTKSRLRREDQFKIVCAKCRQRIVTTDEF